MSRCTESAPSTKIAGSITELIGSTPLLRMNRVNSRADVQVIAKLEYFNPASSIKDRAALGMILKDEESGRLKPGGVIVEPTSGNTGIGIALIAATRGYRVIFTMPENMSEERKTLLKGLGATLILTPPQLGMQGAVKEAEKITSETPGAVMLGQFDNPANADIHYSTTGEEIWRDTGGRVDIFVAAAGTGGTVTGVSRRLKEYNPDVITVAVEPAESPVLSGGAPGPHIIQGIGAGFVPSVMDLSLIDRVVQVSGDDAVKMARRLILEEGVFCGISSGAAASAALKIASEPESAGKTIVFIVCDTADRYLSTVLFQ